MENPKDILNVALVKDSTKLATTDGLNEKIGAEELLKDMIKTYGEFEDHITIYGKLDS